MDSQLLKTTFTTALMFVSLSAWSSDIPGTNESNPVLSAELNSTMNSMNQQKTNIVLESEVTALDNDEYQAAEKQTIFEINKLSSDIKDLERQQRALIQGADRARLKSELAGKRLQLKQVQQSEAQNRLKKADNEKKQAEHRYSQVKAKVELTEQQLAQAKQKNREVLDGIRQIQKDNTKLKSRMTQIKKMIIQEKKRKDGLRSKRVRLTEEGQQLRTQLHKLEKST